MQCSITGEICSEPVISPKTGKIFEKRLILQHLQTKSYDPTVEDHSVELKAEDLIEISVTAPPKQPRGASSIPGLLKTFQNEWDALVLENVELRTQLNSVRQELAHALYQHEAACRVISRLMKERDEARQLLGKGGATITNNNTNTTNNQGAKAEKSKKSEEMEVETLIPSEVINEMVDTNKNLTSTRKQKMKERKEQASSRKDIEAFEEKNQYNLHKSTNPGVNCIDIKDNLYVTGGEDQKTIIFNSETGKVVNNLGDHTGRVTDVLFHPTEKIVFSTSGDATGVARKAAGKTWKKFQTIKHSKSVSGCALSPQGDYWLTASLDSTWSLHNISGSSTIASVEADQPIHSIELHPDGLLLGTGLAKDSALIWDLRTQKVVSAFKNHTDKIESLNFCENGLYVASCSGKVVSLWDLRDSSKPLDTVSLKSPALSARFDPSGQYLAVGSDDLRIYEFPKKKLEEIFVGTAHSKPVTDVCFGAQSSFVVSTSLDRSMKIWE